MKKILFTALILILTISIAVFFACKGDEDDDGTEDILDIFPGNPTFITNNFAQDSSTGFIVQWHCNAGVPVQLVQVAKFDEDYSSASTKNVTVTGYDFHIAHITECVSTNGKCSGAACTGLGNYEDRKIFRAEITGLTPDTKYKYRVGAPSAWSDEYTHQTSKGIAADFSFTVISDTQDSTFTTMKTVLSSANYFDENHKFFLHGGDVVDYIGRFKTEIENYTNVATEFIKVRPIATTQGNHDTYHNKSGDQYVFGESTVFNAFTTFPSNGFVRSTAPNDISKSDSYYFYYNKVLVIFLNTMATQSAVGTAEPNHTAQANWFKGVLQKDKDEGLSDFRIVVTHVPPFQGRGSNRPDATASQESWLVEPVRRIYGPICTEFNVDIFFAGHDHVYMRSNPIKITAGNTTLAQIETDNPGSGVFGPTAGGTVYTVVAATGPKLYAFRDSTFANGTNAFIPKVYPVRQDYSSNGIGVFVNVKVTGGNKMDVYAHRVSSVMSSTQIDTYTVTKK